MAMPHPNYGAAAPAGTASPRATPTLPRSRRTTKQPEFGEPSRWHPTDTGSAALAWIPPHVWHQQGMHPPLPFGAEHEYLGGLPPRP